MIALPAMLIPAAEKAGMKVPAVVASRDLKYDPNEFPHFHVFVTMQCGTSMPQPTSHWTNAKVIAAISEDKIRNCTAKDIIDLGFEHGMS